MKVTQLDLAGYETWPDLSLGRLSPELNVAYGAARSGKTTIAQLAAHLLYGKPASAWRRQISPATPLAEGSLEVDSPHGRYVLRRRRDGSPQGRLMIAAAHGASVDGRTIRSLLCDAPPRLLAELYAVDFAEPPRAQALLQGEFSRQFGQVFGGDVDALGAAAPMDRRRIDELVRRRDEVVRQIEERMSGQLRASAAVEEDITAVEATLAVRRQEAEQARLRLSGVLSQLAEVEARLRVASLEAAVRLAPGIDADRYRAQLDEIDAEVARCRQMLADLQARQATVRRELAEAQSDGAADGANVLADQRATVGVLERLLDDLDGEIAQLARAVEPGRRIGPEAPTRLAPVAEMLRQQLYALCGQVTEQERATRRTSLAAESRQLDRAQTDLSEQLGHLLERRQSLVHAADLAARPAAAVAEPPVARHCQCERHDEFIRRSGAALVPRPDRARLEQEAKRRRGDLERERDVLRSSCDALERDVRELEERWQRLQRGRAQAAGRANLDELRAELERLEAELNRVLLAPGLAAPANVESHRRLWKASDVLAQLTGGQLRQVRLVREGREAVIVDDAGRTLSPEALGAAQQDQLYFALTLALVSSLGQRGIDLPLVLDEPFLRQDAAGVRTMAGVLAEFTREGRQALVFTADSEAVRAFTALGIEIRDIDRLRRREEPAPTPAAPVVATSHAVRVVREPVDGPSPKLRLANHQADGRDEREVYYLAAGAPLSEFPVLGNDTPAAFANLGLHTVDDLLTVEAADVARRLNRPGVSAQTVGLWQRHMSLMCFLPGVSLGDAQVLAACEIGSPAALYTVDVRLLAESVGKFLGSDRGRRFASARQRLSRERLAELQKLARRGRDAWQKASRRYPWVAVERPKRKGKPVEKATVKRTRKAKPLGLPLRFFLERTSPVTQAPSITERAGELLAKAGVRTVADLLNANPQSTAEELGAPTVTASVISRWQNEARLACRIPELRRSAARVLVACGLTEPEQVAGVGRDELVKRVGALCRTPTGQRLLGKTHRPSANEIGQWIRRAAHTRPLEAA